jgi:hypothetical protein
MLNTLHSRRAAAKLEFNAVVHMAATAGLLCMLGAVIIFTWCADNHHTLFQITNHAPVPGWKGLDINNT